MRRAGFEEPLLGYHFRWSIPGLKGSQQGFYAMDGGLSAASGSKGNRKAAEAPVIDPEQEMDRLLEKISRKGIGSRTAAERASLERARQAILQRGGESSR